LKTTKQIISEVIKDLLPLKHKIDKIVNEENSDWSAKYKRSVITIKDGYKYSDEQELEQMYYNIVKGLDSMNTVPRKIDVSF